MPLYPLAGPQWGQSLSRVQDIDQLIGRTSIPKKKIMILTFTLEVSFRVTSSPFPMHVFILSEDLGVQREPMQA